MALRASRRTERAAAVERVLISLVEAATTGLTPQEALELVVAAARTLTEEATVHLWLVGEDGGELRLAAESEARPDKAGRSLRGVVVNVGEGLVGTVAKAREPMVLAALRDEGRLVNHAWAREQGFVSFAGVPLAHADRLLGVLCLFTWRRHRFTRREVSLLRSFAAHAAVALENAALFNAATSRLRRLEALREIEREISLQRDPEALLGLISRRATELLEGDSATAFLLDEATDLLRARASFNTGEWIRDVALPLGGGLAGTVALRREGMIVNDYPRSAYAIPPFRDLDGAVVAQPLLLGDTLHGVIVVTRTTSGRPFSQTDLIQLGDFAVQASIALENARLLRLASARAERVKAAAEVGQLLASTREADRILDLIAEKSREILGAEAFGLFRFESSGGLWYVRGFGLDQAFMREHTLTVGEGVVGKAAAERRSIETADILADPAITLSPAARARIEREGSRAIVAVPILIRGEVLGVLAVYHPVGFRAPAEEAEFLETLASHAAAALENARLFAETRRRQESAETLATLTQTLIGSLDLRTVISLVAEGVRRLLGCDGGAIGLTASDGAIRLAARVGLGADAFRNVVVRRGEGVTGWVLERGEPFWTADYANDPRITPAFAEHVRASGIATVLAVPVRLADETVGVLCGFYGRVVQILDDDVTLASDLARVVAIAVANARLYQEARQREAEARALFEVGRLIVATLDPDRVFDLIVEKVLELMRVQACGIFRLGDDSVLRYARGGGLSSAFTQALAVPVGEGTSGRSVAERAPVWTADVLADRGITLNATARRLVEQEGYRAVLSVPILIQGAPFGCLATYWWESHAPTPGEVETLSSLATLAAVAIENARLYEEAQAHEAEAVGLAEASRRFSATLRRDAILVALVDAASRVVGATWSVLTVEPKTGELRVAAMTGPDCGGGVTPSAADATSIEVGPILAQGVATTGTPVLLRRVDDLPAGHPARHELERCDIRSAVLVPVGTGGVVLAVLAGSTREDARPFGERDVRLAQAIADRAGTALENARLFEELTQAYQDLKTAQEQLVRTEKLRALGEMASGVAHDFNNLLAAILGRVQLIQRKVEDPTLKRWLEVIEQAALDGAQTVRQIQEFTRVRRDQPTQTVDLNRVVRDAVEMMRPRWQGEPQSRGLDVRVIERLESIGPVDGHPGELREVLTNLILNAVDALTHGGAITIATRPADSAVEVSVTDTGVGMPEAVRRRIFEPFFSTKGPRGTGLGLAMVYGIVSRHGGEIAVESKAGAGSTFTVRLPVGRHQPSVAASPPQLSSDAAIRVLVIDDEEHVREILADMLRLQHHGVVVADHGAEGIERFRADSFDLVMTDLAMPGMSGWQVAQAIKSLRPDVPVVLVTGWGVEVPADQLRASGVDRVMAKPFRFEDVQEVVASLRNET